MAEGHAPEGLGRKARAKVWLKGRAGIVGSVTSITTQRPEVVLTFDDGPDPVVTPQLLEVLARHGATATFFVLLEPATQHPTLLRRIEAEGHEVALHGMDHRRLPDLSVREAARSLRSARDELAQLTGHAVEHFRPPHGAQSLATWALTRALGMQVVLWSGTTWDWKDVPQDERVAKALGSSEPGAILLAHDGAHHDPGAPAPVTGVDKVDLLRRILSSYEERGLGAVSLASALSSGASPVKTASFSS